MRTIENRADKGPGEPGLLQSVQGVWDLWSIRIIGPRSFPRVRHGVSMCSRRGIAAKGGVDGGSMGETQKLRQSQLIGSATVNK